MRKERKEHLLWSFPQVPRNVEEQMQGKGAMNFCVFLTTRNELFVRCFHRYKNGELAERQRYVFAKDGAVRYILDGYSETVWKVASKFKEPRFAAKGYPYSFDNTYAILNADAYKQSDMRYSRVGEHRFCCPILYLRLYVRHPNVEYLLKSGYEHLIEESEDYYSGRFSVTVNCRVNLKSNNLLKMLGLNREEFKVLSGWERLYGNYLSYRESFPKYKPQELMEIVHAYGHERGTLESHMGKSGLSALRIARYINEKGITPALYGDYLDQCRQLRYDLSNTAISLPRDFHAMHDRLSSIIRYRADEALREVFLENYAKRRRLEFRSNDLLIRQPESMAEIIAEGKALSHCVGGYAERHAKGQTTILFLRKCTEPDKPYYTVEVSNEGQIRQCYSYKNNLSGNPKPPEIQAFEKLYQHYLTEVFNEKRTQRKLQQSA